MSRNSMSNKYNNIRIINDKVIKTGPNDKIKAEYLMYSFINKNSILQKNFPILYNFIEENDKATIEIEYIRGVTLYERHKQQLLEKKEIENILNLVSLFHSQIFEIIINEENIKTHYYEKLNKRFADIKQYPFNDLIQIKVKIFKLLDKYLEYSKINISSFIHGDLWFSNILVDLNGIIKCIDPRGAINETNTTNGDTLYDYAKLYQSILGFDYAVYGEKIEYTYLNKMRAIFEDEVQKRNINLDVLKYITIVLMSGSIYFLDSFEKKERVWNLIKQTIDEITLE